MNNVTNNPREKLACIFGRRSVRAYTNAKIDDDTLRLLLEAAMAAPSAVAKDPWRFVVVRQPSTLTEIASALPNGRFLAKAAAGIAVVGDIDAAHDRQLSYLLQDCSAAIENLLIAANVLGLGACWLGVHPREDRIKRIREILCLPENIVPVAMISVGYPAERKEPRTRYADRHVHHERW
ncbi:MAG: nitroreductase family protein [Verrucomicrobiota bacterium]|nr:nitroreductase family protein [Verrucomicrobiota bacterium]